MEGLSSVLTIKMGEKVDAWMAVAKKKFWWTVDLDVDL